MEISECTKKNDATICDNKQINSIVKLEVRNRKDVVCKYYSKQRSGY